MVLALCTMFQLASCARSGVKEANNTDKDMQTEEKNANYNMTNSKKVLVAFYSRPGNNYSVGNVKTGNTQILAEMIAKETGATLFNIEPVKPYPADYNKCTEVAKKELNAAARPAVKADIKAEDYDIIFIGYPIWWGDAPMPVYTFIEKHNWKGKTVIPFCTHEGSGMCNEPKIKAACKGATVLGGLGMYGHTAQNDRATAKAEMLKWLGKTMKK